MAVMSFARRADIRIVVTVIGVILAGFGLYYTLSEDKPNISLVVINDTNVLDVHEPVKDLTIVFQGEDIQKEKLNLRILTMKMVNDGEIDILQSHYDMNDTWGIKVTGGEIVEVRLVESNSVYIKSNLNPRLIKDDSLIELEKLIFERGKYFVLEILVLHEKQEMPTIMSVGKVAGIEEIKVSERESESKEQNFIKEVFYGGAWVQVTRIISYLLGVIGVAIFAIFIAIGVAEINEKRVRKSRRNEFRKFVKRIGETGRSQYAKQLEVLSDIYEISGNDSLETTKFLIEDGKRIINNFERVKARKRARTLKEMGRQQSIDDFKRASRVIVSSEELVEREMVGELIKNKIVREGKDKKLIVDNKFKELLDEFIKHSKK